MTLMPAFVQNAAAAAASRNGFDAKLFDYERPASLAVEVTTPTPQQVAWFGRPPEMSKREATAVVEATTGDVKPRAVGPVDVLHLKFRDVDGEVVPALLCTPRGKQGPFPVVVAVHGLTSNKGQVAAQVAPELAKRGIAVLAPDMPRHGERPGLPWSVLDSSNSQRTFDLFRQIVRDVRMCIDVAEQRPELDAGKGVVLMGYSLGSWINAVAGPADDRVKAMVLMVGGAHDINVDALPLAQLRSTDPRTAIANFAPRPILMLNASEDVVVTPDMGRRLFAAANEPKELRWYDCGHLLCADAYDEGAEWAKQVFDRAADGRKSAATGDERAARAKKAG